MLFVCVSGGKEREGDLQYYPFRMTPYLMKVQDAELSEEQFCCLLLAERVHSGYEGETPDQEHGEGSGCCLGNEAGLHLVSNIARCAAIL